MRSLITLVALSALISLPARAAVEVDPVLDQGLKAFETQTNGAQAACQIWYQDRPRLAAEMEAKVYALSKDLGAAIGSEILVTQTLSSRDQRYFGVLYFEKHPVWFMIERYVGREVGKDKAFFLPLKVSLEADDVLPDIAADYRT